MSTVYAPTSPSSISSADMDVRYGIPPRGVRRFSVDEYHRMIEEGYFQHDERFELLEGWIIAKMSRNPVHDAAVDIAEQILTQVLGDGWYVRGQKALTTSDSEPEPDIVIVRGKPRDYAAQHPGPKDVALVIEVANSSLVDDREFKGRVYARAGVQLFWIINLIDRVIEVHRVPGLVNGVPVYTQREVFTTEQTITFSAGDAVVGPISVADFMP